LKKKYEEIAPQTKPIKTPKVKGNNKSKSKNKIIN
jgi:hypothetical protein